MSPWSIGMSRFPGRSWQTNARLWRPSLVLGTRARTTAADPLQPFTFSNNGPSTNEPIPRCANVAASLNHLIRPLQKRLRDGQTERLRGPEVDHELEPCPAPQLGDGREAHGRRNRSERCTARQAAAKQLAAPQGCWERRASW